MLTRASAWDSVISRVIFYGPALVGSDEYKKSILSQLKTVEQIAAGDEEGEKIGAEIASNYQDEFRLLEDVDRVMNNSDGTSPVEKANVLRRALKNLGTKAQGIKRQIIRWGSVNDETRAAEQSLRNLARGFLYGGVCMDVVIAVVVLMFFLNRLNRRLRQLSENAESMQETGPLPNQVAGVDDIADLDSVLHETHRNLQDSREQRQALNQMIAHD